MPNSGNETEIIRGLVKDNLEKRDEDIQNSMKSDWEELQIISRKEKRKETL